MKTTDPRDPLDQQIDALLASRPIKPSDDFASRVLHAAKADTPTYRKKATTLAPVIRFALPIAAAIAAGFVVMALFDQRSEPAPIINIASTEDAATTQPATTGELIVETTLIDEIETQEIFLLEEGLAGLTAQFESDDEFNGDILLETLDALLLEIES